ncbi:hypothetical protein UFOVP221_6 [uncultured Caudovirales phage]|uniref:Uncharacterized protein n=1 Tax=uncultured Caudovirales phage TaxID=2100421 RepID=A0A6J7WQB4_9CAUD|nr:hypothetical protein UFOVP221_6 [uncultured Caudovirales phage]
MTSRFDGSYDQTKPWAGPGDSGANATNRYAPTSSEQSWSYLGPWASNEERLTQQALVVATLSGAQIQEMVRPNLPQLRLFPDRFGYGVRTQPDIEDVVSIDRVYTEPRVSWYSGGVGSYSGSSRNSLAGD